MDGLVPAFITEELPVSFGGILYVEDFDAPEEPAAHAAPDIVAPRITAPCITAEDIEAAREEGRQAGLEAGREDQAALHAALQTAALTAIGDALASVRDDAARVAQSMAEELAATLLAVLQAALPATAEAQAGRELTALIATLLPGLKREPSVVIHINPAMQADIETALRAMWPDHAGRLAVRPDDTLPVADARVLWEDGEARRDTAALWRGIQAALAPYALPNLPALLTGAGDGG